MIVAIARDRDRAAFADLFEHFAPRVKSYMMRLGAPPEGAEELAQETLLIVWRRAEAYDPAKAAASTWVFAIARNLRIDVARRANRAPPRDDPAFDISPGAGAGQRGFRRGGRGADQRSPSPPCRRSRRASSNCLSSPTSLIPKSPPSWICRSAPSNRACAWP